MGSSFPLATGNRNFENNSKKKIPSSLSPSSSSAAVSRTLTHLVFLSFRGVDVRKTLVTHIRGEFQRMGISTYNDTEMERGASLGPELLRAIEAARIRIVIFSKNYASSSWCLDELVEIMKYKDELNQKVMTIFHQVQPADVRHQRGNFGEAFIKTCASKSEDDKQRWRKALTDAANIQGDGVESGKWKSEADMIAAIAIDVLAELQSTKSRDFNDYVCFPAHMKSINSLLCLDKDEVKMIGIWGPSGIGKTTISRVLLNELSPQFQLSARIGDIKRQHSRFHDMYDAKKELQKELVCELLKDESVKVAHLDVAQERFHDKKLLVILDDVNKSWQLEATVNCQWFGRGSRIIITTQDRRVLEQHRIKDKDIYKVDYPTNHEAVQIFCKYAFDQKNPHPGFEDLAKEVSKLTGNLPLALEVMGSHFKQMSRDVWEKELKYFKKTRLHENISDILKFSYKALCVEEKNLFDDIAFFFNGAKIDRVEEIIGDDFSRNLRVLEEKSLIYTYGGTIRMHTLLSKLVREELQECTFLVDAQKICNAFTSNTENKAIRGINFYLLEITDKLDIEERAFEGMPSLEYLEINDFGIILAIYDDKCAKQLEPKVHVPQGLKSLPDKLKLLCWDFFPMKSLPSKFHPNFLVILEMKYSKLEKLWEGNPPLGSLKEIKLWGSKNLKEIPNLSSATSLKRLNLRFCESLVEIPSSIGSATNLEEMDLSFCKNLVKLPYSIGNLNKLERLDMCFCSNLKAIPYNSKLKRFRSRFRKLRISLHNIMEFPTVSDLDLSSTDIEEDLFLSSTDIEEVLPSNQNLLPELPPFNINLESLSRLDLFGCQRLKTFPQISTSIEYLDLSYTAIEEVPSSIWSWFRLLVLKLNFCKSLKVFQPIPDSNNQFSRLSKLHLSRCMKLVSLPQLPDSLSVLDASFCISLNRIQGSFHYPHICLHFTNCNKLSEEARDLIEISDFKYAILPGKEVPAYFEHQENGDILTVNLDQRFKMTSKKGPLPLFLRFKACLLLPEYVNENDILRDYKISCRILCIQNDQVIGSGLCQYFLPLFALVMEHLYFLESSISLEIPEIDVNHMKLEFQFKVEANIEIQRCGVHLKDYECQKSANIMIRKLTRRDKEKKMQSQVLEA